MEEAGEEAGEEEEEVSHATALMTTLMLWKTTLTLELVSKQISLLPSKPPWIAQTLGLLRLEKLPKKQQKPLSARPGAHSKNQPVLAATVRHTVLEVAMMHEIRKRHDKTVLLY